MKRRPWSEHEKRRVRVFYPDVRTIDLARVLGRPVAHVYRPYWEQPRPFEALT